MDDVGWVDPLIVVVVMTTAIVPSPLGVELCPEPFDLLVFCLVVTRVWQPLEDNHPPRRQSLVL